MKLFHCLYKVPEGDALLPYSERVVNGVKGHYLFATPYLSKSLAFAFSYHDHEVQCNGGIEGTVDEFVVINSRSKTLARDHYVRVYSFDDTHFVCAHGHDRQYVSTQPVCFKDTEIVLETSDIKDLMANGLQIFATEKTAEELDQEDFFNASGLYCEKDTVLWLHRLTQNGFVWENAQDAINPNAKLIEAFAKFDVLKSPA